jgi:hypothetical protein
VSNSRNGGRTGGAAAPSNRSGATGRAHSQTRSLIIRKPTTVREASAAEIAQWDELVTRFPQYGLCHKLAWVRSLEASGRGTPLFLVFEREPQIVGCLPGLLVRVGPLRVFGSPLPGWQSYGMGPVFDPEQVVAADLIAPLIAFLEHRHGVHHMEMISSTLDDEAMRAAGFKGITTAATYRCQLFADENAQRKLLKESARRNIKRAIGLGLLVRFEEDERFVDEHYDQICEVFTRGGNAVSFSKRRAVEYFRHMRASGNLLAVGVYLPSGECIATGTFSVEGRELLLWNWTHRTRARWYRPTELMTWTVMRRAAAMGCDTFDMMGRGDFKARFGAELDLTRTRWVRSRYAWVGHLRDVAWRSYRRQQVARGRLSRATRRLLASGLSRLRGVQVTDDEDGDHAPADRLSQRR